MWLQNYSKKWLISSWKYFWFQIFLLFLKTCALGHNGPQYVLFPSSKPLQLGSIFLKMVKITVFSLKTQMAVPRLQFWSQSQSLYCKMFTRISTIDFDIKLKITSKNFIQWFGQNYRAILLMLFFLSGIPKFFRFMDFMILKALKLQTIKWSGFKTFTPILPHSFQHTYPYYTTTAFLLLHTHEPIFSSQSSHYLFSYLIL